MEQKYLYIIVFLVLLIIGFLVYWFVFRDSGGGDYKAGNVEEFNDGTLLECDNSTRFEAVDKENSEDQALCDNLKLKQVFLVECANNINATDYYQEHQTDCPGRDINSIIRGTTVTPFNLLDKDGNKIKLEDILKYNGDIGIDIRDNIEEDIQMNDVRLSDGQRTTCGIQYTIPITRSDRYNNPGPTDLALDEHGVPDGSFVTLAGSGTHKCNFILNLNKNN